MQTDIHDKYRPHADGNTYSHTNTDKYAHTNTDGNTGTDKYAYADTDGNTGTDKYAYADTDGNTGTDKYAYADTSTASQLQQHLYGQFRLSVRTGLYQQFLQKRKLYGTNELSVSDGIQCPNGDTRATCRLQQLLHA